MKYTTTILLGLLLALLAIRWFKIKTGSTLSVGNPVLIPASEQTYNYMGNVVPNPVWKNAIFGLNPGRSGQYTNLKSIETLYAPNERTPADWMIW